VEDKNCPPYLFSFLQGFLRFIGEEEEEEAEEEITSFQPHQAD
jgi:hypothetical protein